MKTLQGRSLKITFSEKKPRTNRLDKSSKKQQDKTCDQDHDDDDDDGDLNNNQGFYSNSNYRIPSCL